MALMHHLYTSKIVLSYHFVCLRFDTLVWSNSSICINQDDCVPTDDLNTFIVVYLVVAK